MHSNNPRRHPHVRPHRAGIPRDDLPIEWAGSREMAGRPDRGQPPCDQTAYVRSLRSDERTARAPRHRVLRVAGAVLALADVVPTASCSTCPMNPPRTRSAAPSAVWRSLAALVAALFLGNPTPLRRPNLITRSKSAVCRSPGALCTLRGSTPVLLAGLSLAFLFGSVPIKADTSTIVIQGGNVERLYLEVENPANANKTIVLTPGTYVLTPLTHGGAPRPHGGGLLLQEGMRLFGANRYADIDRDGVWDASVDADPVVAGATVIDGRGLLPTELLGPRGEPEKDCSGDSTGNDLQGTVVVAYRDRGVISRISVLAGPGTIAIGNPHSAYLPASGFSVTVTDTFTDSLFTSPGVAAGNFGCRLRNAHSVVRIERNIVRGAATGVAVINGLTTQTGDKPAGPSMYALVRGNHFLANYWGLHSRNSLGADGSSVDIYASDNLFEQNALGIEATAGIDHGAITGANGNTYSLFSYHDTFRQNGTDIIGVAGWIESFNTISGTSNNDLQIALIEDRFADPDTVHIWSTFPAPRFGLDKNNRATAVISGSTIGPSVDARFLFIDPVPNDTNTVNLVGSDASFIRSNGARPTHASYLQPPNAFDLKDVVRRLRFVPVNGAYRLSVGPGTLDPNVGPTLDYSGEPNGAFPVDDDTLQVALPFAFPFEGTTYTSVWVNSNGNLTFGAGDSDGRDVQTLIAGPPRIAALMTDLLPNVHGSIHSKTLSDRVVVSWLDIPSSSTNDSNSFQVVLYQTGVIEITFGAVGTIQATVGIAPGNNLGSPLAGVDLSAGNTTGSLVYEEFVGLVGP
jgi:hypothetical protein